MNWLKSNPKSKAALSRALRDLKYLDHSKWYHPKIKHSEANGRGYGFFKKDASGNFIKDEEGRHVNEDPDVMVDDLFYQCHPHLNYGYISAPLYAVPDTEWANDLIEKDIEKLTRKFRKLTYE